MENITYIFSQNRKKNYYEKKGYAKEFYYGLHNFDNDKNNIEIIEFSEAKSIQQKLLLVFDKFMNKFLSLPFYTSRLTNLENLKKIIKTDHLFLIKRELAFHHFYYLLLRDFLNALILQCL